MSTPQHPTERKRLNSWKEIADYLQRDVRTVTRWEQEKGLPVHRTPGVGRQSVFAFADEIDAWLKEPAPMAAYAEAPSAAVSELSRRRWIIVTGAIFLTGALAIAAWIRVRPSPAPPAREPVRAPAVLRFSWPGGAMEFASSRLDTGAQAPYTAVVTRINADQIPDIVLTQSLDSTVAVMLGRGDGTFEAPTLYPVCSSVSFGSVAADLDGDGATDLVVSCHEKRHVRVLWGNADRLFQEYVDLATGDGPRGLSVADLNGDGRPDLAVGNMLGGNVSVFLNRGARKFSAGSFPSMDGVCHITVHDLDNDGKADVVATSTNSSPVTWMKGRGDGTFDSPQQLASFRAGWLHLVADLDGDAFPEIVTTDAQGEVVVIRGKPAGVERVGVKIAGWYAMIANDFNRDGRIDVLGSVAWQNHLLMLVGDGGGKLVPAGSQPIGRYPMLGATGDLNGDGLPDAIFPVTQESAVIVLLQKKPDK